MHVIKKIAACVSVSTLGWPAWTYGQAGTFLAGGDESRGTIQVAPATNLTFRPFRPSNPAPACPPAPPAPITPGPVMPPAPEKKESTPPAKEDNKQAPAQAPAEPNAAAQDRFAGATEAGTQPGAMFNPYMFGDQFGSGRGSITAAVGALSAQSFVTNNGASNTIVPVTNPSGALVIPITNSYIYASPGTNTNFTVPRFLPVLASSPTPINTPVTTTVNATQAYLTLFPVAGVTFSGGGVPLQNNAVYQQFVDALFKQRFGPNGTTVFQNANLSAGVGSTGTPLNSPRASIFLSPSSEVYFNYKYVASFAVPLPSEGGVVGTTKISENNSPMPRDRLIFDYDLFTGVPLTVGSVNVNRFSPGFEKTFFNGRTSIEMRMPFAATVDSSSVAGGVVNRATELGNLHLTFKGLFYASRTVNVSTGVGLALPTAADTQLSMQGGPDLVHVRNESVIVTPYLGGLFTPNDRWFAQTWGQINFDASGSPVAANPNLTGLVGVGRLYDQTLLQLDAQVGYWIVRDTSPSVVLTGLAPFVELHYNSPLNNSASIQSGDFTIGSQTTRYNELNLAMGINTVVRNRFNIMTGVVLPLETGSNRFFDAQFGVRANWLFGSPSSRTGFVSNY